jgi:hypothetical protein
MTNQPETISVGVYRMFHNDPNGNSPDSPLAIQGHAQRKEALHTIFADPELCKVRDWGNTDDTERTHEYVELVIQFFSDPHVQAVAAPVLNFIGGVIVKVATSVAADGVKSLFGKLKGAQERKEIDEAIIMVQNGVTVYLTPKDGSTEVTVQYHNGQRIVVGYNDTEQEIRVKLQNQNAA